MVLIDSIYIHSFGGKNVLEQLLKRIIESTSNLDKIYFLLDERLNSRLIKKIPFKNYTSIQASHKSRKEFYKKNLSNFTSIICLANVPPPLNANVKTTIYFHNVLLLNPFNHKIRLKNKLNNFLKFKYIQYYNLKDYNWIVQSSLVEKLLYNHLDVPLENISVFPIFEEFKIDNSAIKEKNNYLYVSSDVPHKNHKRLIQAFINAAEKTTDKIILHLTVNQDKFENFLPPENLTIKYHGTLGTDKLNEIYRISKFLVYPSLGESFGLPLIEAVQHQCKVIASDLPYVNEVIKPSLQFNPYDIQNMADAILKSLKGEIPNSEVLIKNKIDNFINYIFRDV